MKVPILRTLIFIIPFLCTTRGYGDAFIDDDGHRWYYSPRETGGVNITIVPPLTNLVVPARLGDQQVCGLSATLNWGGVGGVQSVQRLQLPSTLIDITASTSFGRHLSEIIVDPGNPKYESVDNVLYEKNLDADMYGKFHPEDKSLLWCGSKNTSLLIPANVTAFGAHAQRGHYNGVYAASYTTPYRCEWGGASLTSIVVEVGNPVFHSVDGMLCIGEYVCRCPPAYAGVKTIPIQIERLGMFAFNECNALYGIDVEDGHKAFSSENGILYTLNGENLLVIPGGQRTAAVSTMVKTIVNGIASENLYELILPFGVRSVADRAFSYCETLHEIALPSSISSIGDEAFSYCKGVTDITIPPSVTSVGNGAFRGCTSAKTVHVFAGDVERVKLLLKYSGLMSGVTFVEDYSPAENEVRVLFSPNGGTVDQTNVTFAIGRAYGELPVPTRVGYRFGGWYTELTGGTQVMESSVATKANAVLYAHWTPITYKVVFDRRFVPAQGEMAEQILTYDVVQALTPNSFSMSGYAFVGWSDEHGGPLCYVDGDVVENLSGGQDDVVRLYAVWCQVDNDETAAWVEGDVTWRYKVRSDGVEICGASPVRGDVVVPSQIAGLRVVSIGSRAFYGCRDVRSIVVPNGVVKIGEYAFVGCDGLAKVCLPSSVADIGIDSFACCRRIQSVTVPILKTSSYAWINGRPDMSWVFRDSKMTLSELAFADGVKNVPNDCEGFRAVRTLIFPDSVEILGVQSLWQMGITNIIWGTGLKTIKMNGLSHNNMEVVSLPDSLETIEYGALGSNTNLYRVAIGKHLSVIAPGAFIFSPITEFLVDSGNVHYKVKNGCVVNGVENTIVVAPGGCNYVKIPDGIMVVAESACEGCRMEKIVLPTSLEAIADRGFSQCHNITSISIPDNVVSIGEEAFSDCSSLTNVVFGAGLCNLSSDAFFCTELKRLVFKGDVPAGLAAAVSSYDLLDDSYYHEEPTLVWYPRKYADKYSKIIDSSHFGGYTEDIKTQNNAYVVFNPMGGFCEENGREVGIGKAVGTLPIPIKSKYKFDGWHTSASGGTKVSASTKVTADVTYYAHWTYDGSATVSVNFGSGCLDMGTVSGGKTAKAGTKVTLKATAKSGYVFAGWYRDAEFDEPVEGDIDYRTPSYSYVVGEDDAAFYARFIPVYDDDVEIEWSVCSDFEPGVPIDTEMVSINVMSASLPTVKVTGLPPGLRFTAKRIVSKWGMIEAEANTIYGTPTKSGVYTVTVTATTAGKMTATEQFRMIVRGANEYAVSAKGVYRCPLNACCCEYTPSLGAVSGSGVYAPGKTVTLKAPAAPKGQVFAGWYATDDLKYADDEYWWGDPPEDFFEACSSVSGASDYRNSSLAVTVGYEDVGYYALYMYSDFDTVLSTSLEDRYVWEGYDSIPITVESYSLPKITVSGLPPGLKFDAKKNAISGTPTKPGTYTVKLAISNQTIKKAILQTIEIFVPNLHGGADAGVLDGLDYSADAYTMNVAVSDGYPEFTVTTGAKVSVAGLPSGLKYDAQNGRITGVPTKAGVFTATITTTVGTERFVDTVTIKVDALPSWAYGTFNGGSDYGQAQLMISSAGRLSGKYLEDGISYALSAPSFDSHEYGMYHANATVSWTYKDENNKTVKQSELWTIFVEKGAVGGVLTSDHFDAWQNVWAQTVWKGVGLDLFTSRGAVKKLMGDDYGLGDGESVTLTIKPNGTVTVKGVFDTGKTDSRGKAVCYTASGSAVVCVTEDDPFAGQIFVYFPPNAAKGFGGYVWCVQVGE